MSERKLNASIAEIPLPTRMRQLPISSTGYPTPWFVATLADGTRDFRVVDHNKIVQAIKRRLCWCCGQPLGKHLAFVIGPMCAVNRVTAEPPAHRDCALYSVRACPFLTKPRMRRNDVDLPEGATQPPGHAIARNPGAMVLWMTDNYRPFRPPGGGVLIELGEPIELQFYREGRKATRDEVMESIDSGMPILRDLAANEGASAIVQLGRRYQETRTLIEAHA